MTAEWHEQLREWAENGGRGVVMGLPEAVLKLLNERNELADCLAEALEEWGKGRVAYPTQHWIAKSEAVLERNG